MLTGLKKLLLFVRKISLMYESGKIQPEVIFCQACSLIPLHDEGALENVILRREASTGGGKLPERLLGMRGFLSQNLRIHEGGHHSQYARMLAFRLS